MMGDIFTDSCRQSLASMLYAKAEEEKEYQKVYFSTVFFNRTDILYSRIITFLVTKNLNKTFLLF